MLKFLTFVTLSFVIGNGFVFAASGDDATPISTTESSDFEIAKLGQAELSNCEAIGTNSSNPLDPDSLKRKSSFACFLLSGKTPSTVSSFFGIEKAPDIEKALGERCTSFLKTVYLSGKTLFSQNAFNKSSMIKDINFRSGGKQTDFFHYTNAQSILEQFHPEISDRKKAHYLALKEDAYDHFFLQLKKRGRYEIDGLGYYRGSLYVAEDSESSKNYGNKRLTFHLNPSARVIALWGEQESAIMSEIENTYPGIWTICKREALRYFIMEDSGIDLIDYLNKKSWYQMIRPNAIEWVELNP